VIATPYAERSRSRMMSVFEAIEYVAKILKVGLGEAAIDFSAAASESKKSELIVFDVTNKPVPELFWQGTQLLGPDGPIVRHILTQHDLPRDLIRNNFFGGLWVARDIVERIWPTADAPAPKWSESKRKPALRFLAEIGNTKTGREKEALLKSTFGAPRAVARKLMQTPDLRKLRRGERRSKT